MAVIRGEPERQLLVDGLRKRLPEVRVEQQVAEVERVAGVAFRRPDPARRAGPRMACPSAATTRSPAAPPGSRCARSPCRCASPARSLRGVHAGSELRLPVEQQLAAPGLVEMRERSGNRVLLARLVDHCPWRVPDPDQDDGLGPERAGRFVASYRARSTAATRSPARGRCRATPGTQTPWPGRAARSAPRRFQPGQRGRFVGEHRQAAGAGRQRRVPATRLRRQARPFQLDLDPVELAVRLERAAHRSARSSSADPRRAARTP